MAIAALALILVLAIQCKWIIDTAQVKEELFNEKANMVLSKTAEALSADTKTCNSMQLAVVPSAIVTIDSLFRHYLHFYNLNIKYAFQVLNKQAADSQSASFGSPVLALPGSTYKKDLKDIVSENGFELKLNFPNKRQYILAELGPLFFTSILLIFIVIFLFWLTSKSLIKEKKMSEFTRDFLNNTAHELRTPLSNMALAAKMIARETET